jgi:putative FmdB family regulatory protein
MPIYEYGCNDCNTEFEVWQKITATGAACEKCGSENTSRRISATSFVLKGTGWYASDYGGKNGSAKTESKSDDAGGGDKSEKAEKTESKTETKADSADTKKAATA